MQKNTIEKGGSIKIARIDMCETVEEIDAALEKGNYDVLICLELLGERSIAYGSVREWKKRNSLKRIILIVKNERKASLKLAKLYRNDYYDAVYMRHLPDSTIMTELILNGRTEEEAVDYYDIETMDIVQQARKERETAGYSVREADDLKEKIAEDIQLGFENTIRNIDKQMTVFDMPEEESHEEDKNPALLDYFESNMRESYKQNTTAASIPEISAGMQFYEERLGNTNIQRMKNDVEEKMFDITEKKKDEQPVSRIERASVMPHEAYIIAAVSDSALIIEIPGAHFEKNKANNFPICIKLTDNAMYL